MTTKRIKQLLNRKDLISSTAYRTELGYKTFRFGFNDVESVIWWIEDRPFNSVKFTFGNLWKDEKLEVIELTSENINIKTKNK